MDSTDGSLNYALGANQSVGEKVMMWHVAEENDWSSLDGGREKQSPIFRFRHFQSWDWELTFPRQKTDLCFEEASRTNREDRSAVSSHHQCFSVRLSWADEEPKGIDEAFARKTALCVDVSDTLSKKLMKERMTVGVKKESVHWRLQCTAIRHGRADLMLLLLEIYKVTTRKAEVQGSDWKVMTQSCANNLLQYSCWYSSSLLIPIPPDAYDYLLAV
jgi:hypothetical protein